MHGRFFFSNHKLHLVDDSHNLGGTDNPKYQVNDNALLRPAVPMTFVDGLYPLLTLATFGHEVHFIDDSPPRQS